MPKIVIKAEVEDAGKWEEGFRTHGDLFRKQTVKNVDFSMSDNNRVVCMFEAEDLDTYMQVLRSDETAAAMAFDGVKRETVEIHVLDTVFTP